MRLARFVLVLVAAVSVLLGGTVAASAATPAVLGGGSGIVVDDAGFCTLTTIGHDAGGRLVGFTAGHCGVAGSAVTAESDPDAGVVGTFAFTDPELDYAVIVFDSSKVTPVNRVGDTTITAVGEPAQFPAIACKEGRSTGRTCGVAYGDVLDSGHTWTQACVAAGDSGAPVVVGTTLVSMVNGYLSVPCIGPQLGVNMTAVIADVNSRGGVGAGYRPVQAELR